LLVVGLSIFLDAIVIKLNLSEVLFAWTRPLEQYQLDELPFILLLTAMCLIWFSWRRHREAERELALRRVAEAKLETTLSDNRRLVRQYAETQEIERKNIARDLHDEMGQYLTVLKLDAVFLREAEARRGGDSHELAAAIVGNVERVSAVATGLIRQLRPVALDTLGLTAALQSCVADWRRRLPGTTIDLSIEGEIDTLAEQAALALFRLVQEALTNVARHSQATAVAIRISRVPPHDAQPDSLSIAIADDGVGMDLTRRRTGLGLLGMSERLAGIGGTLTIESALRQGLTLKAIFPYSPGDGATA
jgi:two-component system sensor histidine kinase UhpB